MAADDSNRLSWIEQHTMLYDTMLILYVADGYAVSLCVDGAVIATAHGGTVRDAIDGLRLLAP